MVKLKLRKQGGSLALTRPKEVVREMGIRAGQSVHLMEVAPGEFRLTPFDPETAAALKVHDAVMTEYKDAFRALAR